MPLTSVNCFVYAIKGFPQKTVCVFPENGDGDYDSCGNGDGGGGGDGGGDGGDGGGVEIRP